MIVFKQITSSGSELYGLDEEGRVWKYIPSKEDVHYSFWSRLTAFGMDGKDSEE